MSADRVLAALDQAIASARVVHNPAPVTIPLPHGGPAVVAVPIPERIEYAIPAQEWVALVAAIRSDAQPSTGSAEAQ